MAQARVSVVIPLFNMRNTLGRALDSIRRQTQPPEEILVVDDGSTDGGGALAAAFPDVRVLVQSHAGPGAARNRGVVAARGEWIAFLDADDRWREGFLARALQAARTFPEAAAVFANYSDAVTQRPLLQLSSGQPFLVDDYFALLMQNRGFGPCSSALLVRRSALLSSGQFLEDCVHGEDVDTWARLAWSFPIACLPEPLAVYHTDTPGSLVKSAPWAAPPFPPLLRTYVDWRDSGRIPERLAASSRLYARWLLGQQVAQLTFLGRKSDAIDVVLQALRHGIASPIGLTALLLRIGMPSSTLRLLRRAKSRLLRRGLAGRWEARRS